MPDVDARLTWTNAAPAAVAERPTFRFSVVLLRLLTGSSADVAGLTWTTFHVSLTPEYQFSAARIFGMLGLDIFLYGLLAWYCDKVRVCEVCCLLDGGK
jgi:hypothetical protein